jgi:hypothetical protein
MKLLPLTEDYLRQLRHEGYTHIVLKRIVEARDRDFTSDKELHIYEAFPPNHPVLEKFISLQLDSTAVAELLKKTDADYYVVVSNSFAN